MRLGGLIIEAVVGEGGIVLEGCGAVGIGWLYHVDGVPGHRCPLILLSWVDCADLDAGRVGSIPGLITAVGRTGSLLSRRVLKMRVGEVFVVICIEMI